MVLVCSRVHAPERPLEPPAVATWKMYVPLIYNQQRKQNCKSHPQIFLIVMLATSRQQREFPRAGRSPPSLDSLQLSATLSL